MSLEKDILSKLKKGEEMSLSQVIRNMDTSRDAFQKAIKGLVKSKKIELIDNKSIKLVEMNLSERLLSMHEAKDEIGVGVRDSMKAMLDDIKKDGKKLGGAGGYGTQSFAMYTLFLRFASMGDKKEAIKKLKEMEALL